MRGVTITSWVDVSGEPGFDMAIGNSRSAQLSWPTSFEVLRVVRNQPAEFHKEKGAPGRGYGNHVEIRFRDPATGRLVDVLSAHHDRINPALRPGGRYPAGTIIGNQGRTGSTDGPHFSLDFFDPGRKYASAATLSVRDRFRDGFKAGSSFGNPRPRSRPGGSAGVPRSAEKFLRFLAALESDGRNSAVGYAEAVGGGRARGRFQFTPITLQDAKQRFGISPAHLLSNDEATQHRAVLAFIRQAHPSAYSAIVSGRYSTAERLLNRRWTSLSGGAEQASAERRARAMEFLR